MNNSAALIMTTNNAADLLILKGFIAMAMIKYISYDKK